MIEAGTVLQDRYRVQKQIGQGGMGAVYVGTDERFGSTVAIKETLFTDANYGKAFEREARLLNNLRHPALPRVSDHFSDSNGQFIVMEYIAGDDLSEKMEKSGEAFPLKDVLDWADQLLDALDYLHTQEMPVIHRDIKPQNLKLTSRGQIILLDFGLAKGNPTDAQHQTAAKSVFGYSRNYASLEQMQGTGTDPRSDLYSLGATLFHLLTGVPPVDALTRAMQVLNGDQDPLKSANETHPNIPIGISEVLQRALALNANFRPTSAVAMRAMLAESEATNVEVNQIPIKKPATSLLTQNTEVFESTPQSKQTEQAAIKTEILPVEHLSEISAQPENTDDKSILTEIESAKRNIQIPVQPKTETKIQPLATTNSNGKQRGLAIGTTALGGLLLVGSALGGLYLIKPNIFSDAVSNSTQEKTPNDANKESILANSSNVSSSNSNTLAIASGNSNVAESLTKKEITEKPSDKTTAEVNNPKSPVQPKDTQKETTETKATDEKNDGKVVVVGQDGTKVFESGKVITKDGTTITQDGKIIKNGVVVTPPNPNVQVRPLPPNVRTHITEEQFRNMTPAQRRRLKQIMENQRRKTENRPPPEPYKQP